MRCCCCCGVRVIIFFGFDCFFLVEIRVSFLVEVESGLKSVIFVFICKDIDIYFFEFEV